MAVTIPWNNLRIKFLYRDLFDLFLGFREYRSRRAARCASIGPGVLRLVILNFLIGSMVFGRGLAASTMGQPS